MVLKMSKHASVDRFDRFEEIIDCGIEIGEEFCRSEHKDCGDREEILTTTGILLVVAKHTNVLITGYTCSADKANIVYQHSRHNDSARLPMSMVKKIERNQKLIALYRKNHKKQ